MYFVHLVSLTKIEFFVDFDMGSSKNTFNTTPKKMGRPHKMVALNVSNVVMISVCVLLFYRDKCWEGPFLLTVFLDSPICVRTLFLTP
jgi:hypothetical protein